MSPAQKPQSKKSGGKSKGSVGKLSAKGSVGKLSAKGSVSKPSAEVGESIPLTRPPAEFGAGQGGKTLVVHDEKGRIVSVTHVSRDARYGVGIKPGPGQVVKELEATEDLRDALKPPHR